MPMTFDELNRLIEHRENTSVDFKREVSEEVLQGLSTDLASFANANGGMLVFGVTDSRDPVGCALDGKERERISQQARNCQPPVVIDFEEIPFGKRRFLVVRVPRSNVVHSDVEHRFPHRIGDTTAYLDTLGIIMALQQRGVVQAEGTQQLSVQPGEKREPLSQGERDLFAGLLESEDLVARTEALRDLSRFAYRSGFLDDSRIASHIAHSLEGGGPSEEANRSALQVVRNVFIVGTDAEKAVASQWISQIVRLAKSSASAETARAAFDVLENARRAEVSEVVAYWVTQLNERLYSALQVPSLVTNLRYFGLDHVLRKTMYDLLVNESGENTKKRVAPILEGLRQNY